MSPIDDSLRREHAHRRTVARLWRSVLLIRLKADDSEPNAIAYADRAVQAYQARFDAHGVRREGAALLALPAEGEP